MPIRVVKEVHEDEDVDFHTIIQIIETNRDRVRTIGNMILTVCGIILSATFAFLLFLFDKGTIDLKERVMMVLPFGGAIFTNLLSIYFGIASSFLKTRYAVSTKINMITDLLTLFYSELRLVRISFIFLILGLLLITVGTFIFVFAR